MPTMTFFHAGLAIVVASCAFVWLIARVLAYRADDGGRHRAASVRWRVVATCSAIAIPSLIGLAIVQRTPHAAVAALLWIVIAISDLGKLHDARSACTDEARRRGD